MSTQESSRHFNIVEVKKLYNRQNFAYFNLQDGSIILNKTSGGGKRRKHFDCNSFILLEKGGDAPSTTDNVSLLGSISSPLSYQLPKEAVTRDDLRLRVTISPYNQPLQRRIWEFDSMSARDCFVDLICALTLSNHRAFHIFSNMSQNENLNVEEVRLALIQLGIDPSLLFQNVAPLSNGGKIQTKNSNTLDTANPVNICNCPTPPGISRTQISAFRMTHPHHDQAENPITTSVNPMSVSRMAAPNTLSNPNNNTMIVTPSGPNNKDPNQALIEEGGSANFKALQSTYTNLQMRMPVISLEGNCTPSLAQMLAATPGSPNDSSKRPIAPTRPPPSIPFSLDSSPSSSPNPYPCPPPPALFDENDDSETEFDVFSHNPYSSPSPPPSCTQSSFNTDKTLDSQTHLQTLPLRQPPPARSAPRMTSDNSNGNSKPPIAPKNYPPSTHAPTRPVLSINSSVVPPPPEHQAPSPKHPKSNLPVPTASSHNSSLNNSDLPPVPLRTQPPSDKLSQTAALPQSPPPIPRKTPALQSSETAPLVPMRMHSLSFVAPPNDVTVISNFIKAPATRRNLLHNLLKHTASAMRNPDLTFTPSVNDYMYSFESFLFIFLDVCSLIAELLQVPLGGPIVAYINENRSLDSAIQQAMLNKVTTDTITLSSPSDMLAQSNQRSVVDRMVLCHGEQIILTSEHVYIEEAQANASTTQGLAPRKALAPGTIVVTNYRLLFISSLGRRYEVPMGMIYTVVESQLTQQSNFIGGCLTIRTKDLRTIKLYLDGLSLCSSIQAFINQLAFPGEQTSTFAYMHKFPTIEFDGFDLTENSPIQYPPPCLSTTVNFPPYSKISHDGWTFYSPEAEYTRMGFHDAHSAYRWCTLNADYKVSPTYPRLFIVPRNISDAMITKICKFRSRGRLPAIVYMHPVTGATMSRCAQPLVGLIGKSCSEDEALVASIRECNSINPNVLHFLDCRPIQAAIANKLAGKGSENVSRYKNTLLQYLNIDNIHAMTSALEGLHAALEYSEDIKTVNDSMDTVQSYLNRLGSSKWLYYLALILASSSKVCQIMAEQSSSVLIHCSDGWDRTSQLCALSQLMIDPYFRTKRGFAILIEKEWLSYGHQFAFRSGHATNVLSSQRSPVFLQFLDCCYQLLRQYPYAFEFTEEYLLFLTDAIYTCKYGTFLYDNERERVENEVKTKTTSVWTYLCHPSTALMFTNVEYRPLHAQLTPDCTGRRIVLWEKLYQKYLPHGPYSCNQVSAAVPISLQGDSTRVNLALNELLRRCKANGVDVEDIETDLHSVFDSVVTKCSSGGLLIDNSRKIININQLPNGTSPLNGGDSSDDDTESYD